MCWSTTCWARGGAHTPSSIRDFCWSRFTILSLILFSRWKTQTCWYIEIIKYVHHKWFFLIYLVQNVSLYFIFFSKFWLELQMYINFKHDMHNPKFYLDKLNFLQAILTDFLIFCMKLGQVKLIHRIWKTNDVLQWHGSINTKLEEYNQKCFGGSYFSELASINMHLIEQNSKYILPVSYLTLHSDSQPLKEI